MSGIQLAALSRAIAHIQRGLDIISEMSQAPDTIEDNEGEHNGTQD